MTEISGVKESISVAARLQGGVRDSAGDDEGTGQGWGYVVNIPLCIEILGTAFELANWVGGPYFTSNYKGITLLSLPGLVYARVLERNLTYVSGGTMQVLGKFCQGHGTVDNLFTVTQLYEGSVLIQSTHVCGF